MKKTFTLNKNMLSMLGSTFYPTNHIMVVSNQENTLSELIDFIENNLPHNDYYVLPPEQIISVLGPTVVDNDTPLPSVGTEGANVRSYVKLAKEGPVLYWSISKLMRIKTRCSKNSNNSLATTRDITARL